MYIKFYLVIRHNVIIVYDLYNMVIHGMTWYRMAGYGKA